MKKSFNLFKLRNIKSYSFKTIFVMLSLFLVSISKANSATSAVIRTNQRIDVSTSFVNVFTVSILLIAIVVGYRLRKKIV